MSDYSDLKIIAESAVGFSDVSLAPDVILGLIADAERYRWLRDNSESIHQFYLSTPIWFTGVKFSKGNVDDTIDAAMRRGD